jgi:hypothetical protein
VQSRHLIGVSVAACLALTTAAFGQASKDANQATPLPGQEGKQGTTATGGAPGAEAAPGTEGGAAPVKDAGGSSGDCPQGMQSTQGSPCPQAGVLPGQQGKQGTTATGGAPGAEAAPGTQGGTAVQPAKQ